MLIAYYRLSWLLLKLYIFASISYLYDKQMHATMSSKRIKPSGAAYRKAAKEKLIKTANLISKNSKLTNFFTSSGTSVLSMYNTSCNL